MLAKLLGIRIRRRRVTRAPRPSRFRRASILYAHDVRENRECADVLDHCSAFIHAPACATS